MVDSAVLSFKPNTEFAFNSYSYDGDPATADSAVMTMVRGGFRTLSGSIGEEDQDDYRIDTPFASIGIRGTVHEAVLDGDVLYTGVYEGGTTISNNFGSVDTGIGAEFDFSITLPEQAPQGLLVEPAILGQSSIEIVIASAEEDGDTTDGNGAQTTVAAAVNNDGDNGGGNAGAGNAAAAANNPGAGNNAGTTTAATNQTPQTGNTADSEDILARLDTLGLGNQGVGQAVASTARNALTTTTTVQDQLLSNQLNNPQALASVNSASNKGNSRTSTDDDVNPALFSRDVTELGSANANSNSNGNGNSGNSNGNSGNGNGNSGNGNSNSGSTDTSTSPGNSGNSNGGGQGNNSNTNTDTTTGGGSNGNGNGGGQGNTTNTDTTTGGGSNGNGNGGGQGNTTNTDTTTGGGSNGNGNGGGQGNTTNTDTTTGGGSNGNGNGGGQGNTTNTDNTTGGGSNGNGGGNSGNGGTNNGNGNNSTLLADLGYWNLSGIQAQVLDSMAAQMQRKTLSGVEWPVAFQAEIADLTGSVAYQSTGLFSGSDEAGRSLLDVAMSFIVDFSGGPQAISQGQLSVVDGSSRTWAAGFNGSLSGAFAEMQVISGYLSTGAPITEGQIQGIFTGTNPDFLSGFFLQSGDNSVQGFTVLKP